MESTDIPERFVRLIKDTFTAKSKTGLVRWLGHFDILEAIETSDGCPLCALTYRTVETYLDSYLYEFVNDPYMRSLLRQCRGFCSDHAWQALQIATGMFGMAITYEDITHTLLETLQEGRRQVSPAFKSGFRLPFFSRRNIAAQLSDMANRLRGRGRCPACAYADRMGEVYLKFALDLLDDKTVAADVAERLCFRHFLDALRHVRSAEHFDLLTSQQATRLESLNRELAEFVRKHDYRFIRQGFGAEGDSWRRATLHVAGIPKIVSRDQR